MNWPTPNEHGVYEEGVKTIHEPGGQAELRLVQTGEDEWRYAVSWEVPNHGGGGALPARHRNRRESRQEAVVAAASELLWAVRGDLERGASSTARWSLARIERWAIRMGGCAPEARDPQMEMQL